jgi:hypothetical protein
MMSKELVDFLRVSIEAVRATNFVSSPSAPAGGYWQGSAAIAGRYRFERVSAKIQPRGFGSSVAVCCGRVRLDVIRSVVLMSDAEYDQ